MNRRRNTFATMIAATRIPSITDALPAISPRIEGNAIMRRHTVAQSHGATTTI